MASYLRVKGINNIISGGYNNEIVQVDNTYQNWVTVPENNPDGIVSWYTYRDSNNSSNFQSSETRVEILTKWTSELDDYNRIHITTKTYLQAVFRTAVPATPGGTNTGDTGKNRRSIYVFPGKACSPGKVRWSAINIPIRYDGPVAGSPTLPVLVKSNEYIINPSKDSDVQSAITIRNVVEGYESTLCSSADSKWRDVLEMGFMFGSLIPNELLPPSETGLIQTPDICNNTVDATLTFDGPNVNGTQLYIEWIYAGQDWSMATSAVASATRETPVEVVLGGLMPTNHTSRPVQVYWRAQFQPVTAPMVESDWSYGDFTVEYVPAPNMTVPDITTEECRAISKGNYIEPWTSEQCYNEVSCADQSDIRDQLEAAEYAANRECRIVNGVALADDLKGGE